MFKRKGLSEQWYYLSSVKEAKERCRSDKSTLCHLCPVAPHLGGTSASSLSPTLAILPGNPPTRWVVKACDGSCHLSEGTDFLIRESGHRWYGPAVCAVHILPALQSSQAGPLTTCPGSPVPPSSLTYCLCFRPHSLLKACLITGPN